MTATVEEGIFLRIPSKTLSEVYRKLESEGYKGDPVGISLFLTDFSAGKFDDDGSDEGGDITPVTGTEVVASLIVKHGPTVARGLADLAGKVLRKG